MHIVCSEPRLHQRDANLAGAAETSPEPICTSLLINLCLLCIQNFSLLPTSCDRPYSVTRARCVGDTKKAKIRTSYRNTQACSSPRQQVALETHGFQVPFPSIFLWPHAMCSLPGLCALSINHSNSYLAYPGSQSTGEIVLYDGNSLVSSQRSLVYQPACPGQLVNRLDKKGLSRWGKRFEGALWPQRLGEGKERASVLKLTVNISQRLCEAGARMRQNICPQWNR